MFVPGDAEVILRRISSVQRYKAVGSKEQQENQDRMLSGNADEDKYPIFLPFSHSGRGQSQRRVEGRFHADTWRHPMRGERGHLAISHRSGYWESRKQSVDGNTMAYSIPGETNEAATWNPPPQVQVQTEQRRFLMKFLLATEIVFLLRECTEEGLCRPQAPSAIQRRVML